MKSRYKISISNRNVYKEIELTPEMEHLSVGTAVGCERNCFLVSLILNSKR